MDKETKEQNIMREDECANYNQQKERQEIENKVFLELDAYRIRKL